MLPILWIVFVLFVFVLYTLYCQFSGLFLFCFSSSCIPYVANSLDCFCFVCLRLVYPMLPILWIVFVLFFFVLYTLCCQFSGLFLFCLSLSCIPYVANSLDCFCFVYLRLVYPMLPILWIVFVLFVFVLYTLYCQFSGLFLFCFSSSCIPYVADSLNCNCFVCLCLVYPMLPILWIVFVLFFFVLYTLCCQFSGLFLLCFSSSCMPYVANSLDCFCFVCLCLVYPMLPILWIVFVLFVFVLYTLCCQFSGLFLLFFSSSCMPYVANSLDCFCFVFLRLVYPILPIYCGRYS